MDLFAKCDLRTNGLCQIKTCSGMLQANGEAPVLDADLNTKYQASCFLVSPPYVRMVTLAECVNSLPETAGADEASDSSGRNGRYAAVESRLAVYARMRPSVNRFMLLCATLKDGMSEACRGEPDFEVWKEAWLTATLQLLSEDPCGGECNLLERQNLFNAISPAFGKMVELFYIVQSVDPDATVVEFDYFFQDINSVMTRCWRKHPETGKMAVVVTPDFVTRDGNRSGWEFDATNIRTLSAHCVAENAVERFKSLTISDQDRDLVEASNISSLDSKCGNLSVHLLFQAALMDAEKVVPSFETADDEIALTILRDGCELMSIFQPFYGTYYDPYTHYPERIEKDKELGFEIPADIAALKDWITRLFKRLGNIASVKAQMAVANAAWQKISVLYDFRMMNPYSALSREKQVAFQDRIIELNDALGVVATDGDVRAPMSNYSEAKTIAPSGISEADKQDIANRTVAAIKKSTFKSVVVGYTKTGAAATREIVEPRNPDPAKAFPFVCGYDENEEWIEMNVYDAYNKLGRRRFTIRNKKQWFYIKQLVDSKVNPVKLEKYDDERINLSAVFRESQGDDGADFYKYVYSTTGSQARYWLEQRQRPRR